MCIYCNLICKQWELLLDDPCEVHKTRSPHCPYVKSVLVRHGARRIINDNSSSTRTIAGRPSFTPNHLNPEFVRPTVQNNNGDSTRNNLSSDNQSPSIDDNIQAYFNTDAKNIVVCPCCNGSFRYFDSDEDTMIDHARRFRQCPYVKQLQGVQIYHQIHKSKCRQQSMFGHNLMIKF